MFRGGGVIPEAIGEEWESGGLEDGLEGVGDFGPPGVIGGEDRGDDGGEACEGFQGGGEIAGAEMHPCEAVEIGGVVGLFLDGEGDTRRLVPLVYVPKAGTTFWESSCASGSSAVGMWLAHEAGAPIKVDLVQPGGTLGVSRDPATDETWLSGHVRLL